MLKFHQTIKGKFIISVSLVVIVLNFFLNSIIIINDRDSAREAAGEYLEDGLLFLSTALVQSLWDYDQDTLSEILLAMMSVDYVAAIELLDENNHVIKSYEKQELIRLDQYLHEGDKEIFYNHQKIGKLHMVVSSYYLEQAIIKEMDRDYILSIVTVLMIIIVIFYLTQNITKPLRHLEMVADNISSGNLENEINRKGNDEIASLAKAIEVMQGQLIQNRKDIIGKVEELQLVNQTVQEKNNKIALMYEEQVITNEQLRNMVDEVNETYRVTVLALANSIEASDSYTRGHCDRVRRYSLMIGTKMGLSKKEMIDLEYAAVLHDIGKIGVPEEVLNKEASLTEKEFDLISNHPYIGYDIIKDIPFLKDSAQIVLQHHERLDCKGYPSGLCGEDILLLAQILCVADAYDAMTTARPYRKEPLSHKTALIQLVGGINTQFNADVVNTFIDLMQSEREVDLDGYR